MRIPWKTVPILAWAQAHEQETKALIGEMVEIESPSDDRVALARFADWFGSQAPLTRAHAGHLQASFGEGEHQVLVLGHYDTVWPLGTLANMPFREEGGRLWGPGVLDMKGGIAFFLMAMRALHELGIGAGSRVVLQLNADEEVGSPTSREITEANARASAAVLVLEPGTGLTGKLKTARKGVGEYRLTVRGRASHAGVDFAAGASAVLELSRQILKIAEFTDMERGITVNPGVVSGGTRSNVVASEASAQIDIRIARLPDAALLDSRFQALQPVDERCTLAIEGGLNRPPMERSGGVVRLFQMAQTLGREIGIDVEESSTGGGSDGNFTAALGIPTLDGLGTVGEGAHAANESILVDRMTDRIALLAMLLAEVGAGI